MKRKWASSWAAWWKDRRKNICIIKISSIATVPYESVASARFVSSWTNILKAKEFVSRKRKSLVQSVNMNDVFFCATGFDRKDEGKVVAIFRSRFSRIRLIGNRFKCKWTKWKGTCRVIFRLKKKTNLLSIRKILLFRKLTFNLKDEQFLKCKEETTHSHRRTNQPLCGCMCVFVW